MKARRRFSRSPLRTPQFGVVEYLEDRTLLTGNVTAAVMGGNLKIVGDNSANQISIQSTAGGLQITSLDGTTKINGGNGPVTLSGVTGNASISMGRGDDVLKIGGGAVTTTFAHNVSIDVGDGNDTLNIATTSIGGNLSIAGGNGSDTFTIGSADEATVVSIGGNLCIVGGQGHDNTIAVFNADITGSASVTAMGRTDHVQFGYDEGLGLIGDETTTGRVNIGKSLSIRTGDGADHIALADVIVGGSTSINSGDGIDEILVGAAHSPATDSNPLVNLVFGPVTVGGDLKVSAGDGSDSRSCGSNRFDAMFCGGWGWGGCGGGPNVSTGNGSGDTVILVGVTVTGNTSLQTGNGDDHIAILGNAGGPNESFGGSVKIDSGRGNDAVVIADQVVFLGKVTINLNNGDDTLWFAGNLFQQSVAIIGGSGHDTFMQSTSIFPNEFDAGPPTENSIESDLPDVAPSDPEVVAAFGWLSSLLGI